VAEYAVPVLSSRDLRETLTFYEQLGFENRGAPPEEWDYLILGRGGVELHFVAAPATDRRTGAASCFVYVPDADALHEEWEKVGVAADAETGSRLETPMSTDYGMREFDLVDRSGNVIRVGSPLRT
jgi:hypothetical protein